MQRMLNRFRDALDVAALPQEMTAAADQTIRFSGRRPRASGSDVQLDGGRLRADVIVDNLGPVPAAYPSRRVLHRRVARRRRVVFESGALNADVRKE